MRIGALFVILVLSLWGMGHSGEPKIPRPQGLINDYAGIIAPEYRKKLDLIIRNTLDRTGVPIVILTMPEIGGYDYNEYANLVYNNWGIGKKGEDKGILIFVTLKERKMRIETGYGVEGVLPDGLVGEIRDRYMIPYFRQDRFGEGLLLGVEAISKILGGERLPPKPNRKELPPALLAFIVLFTLLVLALGLWARHPRKTRVFGVPVYFSGFGSGGGSFGGGFSGFGGGMSGGGGAGGSF